MTQLCKRMKKKNETTKIHWSTVATCLGVLAGSSEENFHPSEQQIHKKDFIDRLMR